MVESNTQAEAFLDYWFSEPVAKCWFRSTPEFDAELRERYEGLVQQALSGELSHWQQGSRSALALVLLLDQLPLNIYRGRPESFAGEAPAREVARHIIEQGWDEQMADKEKAFVYITFMHSENLDDQDRSVALYRAAGLTDNLRWAEHHREIVRRFGRFPHRNAILGRESTAGEQAWLASDEAFQG